MTEARILNRTLASVVVWWLLFYLPFPFLFGEEVSGHNLTDILHILHD